MRFRGRGKRTDIVCDREGKRVEEKERRSERGKAIGCVKPKITMIGTRFAVIISESALTLYS